MNIHIVRGRILSDFEGLYKGRSKGSTAKLQFEARRVINLSDALLRFRACLQVDLSAFLLPLSKIVRINALVFGVSLSLSLSLALPPSISLQIF